MAEREEETSRAKRKKDAEREQSGRFKETAREIEADENAEKFERAFGLMVPPKLKNRRSQE
jgi:hypothetical protein